MLTAISLANGNVERTIWIYGQPRSMVITPDGKTLYVSNFARDDVLPISVATFEAGRAIKAGPGPGPMVITPNGRSLFVVDVGGFSRTVTPISVGAGTARAAIAVGRAPLAAAITPDGKTLYVITSLGIVRAVSVATDTAEGSIRVGRGRRGSLSRRTGGGCMSCPPGARWTAAR